MPESTVAAPPAAPAPQKPDAAPKVDAALAEKAKTAAAPADKSAEKAVSRALKVAIPDIGDVDIPEEDAVALLAEFARLNTDDYKAKKELKELEVALEDDEKLAAFLQRKGKDPGKLSEAMLKRVL